MPSIIISELGEEKQLVPIVLLIIAVDTEVLLEDLVHTLCLSVGLWVEGGGFVAFDIA
jgi:hypothetical protein